MPFDYGKSARDRRPRRVAPLRRTFDTLERRDLLALVVAPLNLTEDIPFSGTIATFASSDIPNPATAKASINWGDGTDAATGTVVADSGGTTYRVIAPITYTQFGSFPVTVTVSDQANTTSIFGAGSATVSPAPLTPNGTSLTAFSGIAFNGVVGSFQDIDAQSAADDFSITINWGDGITSTGTAVLTSTGSSGPRRYNVTGTHTYAAPGQQTIDFTVVRTASGQSVSDQSSANVIAPQLALNGTTITGSPGTELTDVGLATLVDSNTSSTASDFTATVQWGNGLPTTGATIVPVKDANNADIPGRYAVKGTFTYPSPGTFAPVITVVRVSSGQQATTTIAANITAPSLIATGTSINPTAGTQFQGVVASFTDSTPGSKASDFTATIKWDAAATTTTQGTIVQTGPGAFNVIGTFTYENAGNQTAEITIKNNVSGDSAPTQTAVVVDRALANSPIAPVTATASQPFTGRVMSFSGGDGAEGESTNFTATIDWGDGQTSPGTVSFADETYSVVGTHTYAAPGAYNIKTTAVRSSNNQALTALVSASVYTLTGGLDPQSLTSVVNNTSITNQQLPVLSGTAEPRSVVTLSYRRVAGGDPVALGQTIADVAGKWSMIVGPLGGGPFLLYAVATPVTGPPTPITLLNGGQAIAVQLHPVRVMNTSLAFRGNQLTFRISRQSASSPDPAGLLQASSYALITPSGQRITPTSVRLVRGRMPSSRTTPSITLTFARNELPRRGQSTLLVSFDGLANSSNHELRLPVRSR